MAPPKHTKPKLPPSMQFSVLNLDKLEETDSCDLEETDSSDPASLEEDEVEGELVLSEEVLVLCELIWGSEYGGKSDDEDAGEEVKKNTKNGKAGSSKITGKDEAAAVEGAAAAPAAKTVLSGRSGYESWLVEDLSIKGEFSEELVRKGVSLMDKRKKAELDMKKAELDMKKEEFDLKKAELEMKKDEVVKGHIGAILEALKSGSKSEN